MRGAMPNARPTAARPSACSRCPRRISTVRRALRSRQYRRPLLTTATRTARARPPTPMVPPGGLAAARSDGGRARWPPSLDDDDARHAGPVVIGAGERISAGPGRDEVEILPLARM